jgi:hypothetical protein|tara:strand:- start:117 stop:269 length:153 start_codon:yes stop_codon:yes gene_type:complete
MFSGMAFLPRVCDSLAMAVHRNPTKKDQNLPILQTVADFWFCFLIYVFSG